ncbi:MAG: hypothetical protein E7130_05355 [Rikenellaceae bacterium]|nr:hypothetical protein [Rikenellaceae bacterium]
MTLALIIIFGVLGGCLLSVLVGILGSKRELGFGWAFLLSLIFTPFVGLICALISDPLPQGAPKRWGCLGVVVAILGFLFLGIFLFLLLGSSLAMLAAV